MITTKKPLWKLQEAAISLALVVLVGMGVTATVTIRKQESDLSTDLTRIKKITAAMLAYAEDNDSRLAPSDINGKDGKYWPGEIVWGELIFPYHKDWLSYRCPADPHANDQDLSRDPIDNHVLSEGKERDHAWAARSNRGMNAFLSPWYILKGGPPESDPTSLSQVVNPASTLATVTTLWDRDSNSGAPLGGGNWVASAPCLMDANGKYKKPYQVIKGATYYTEAYWRENKHGIAPFSWYEFGGSFPWFHGPDLDQDLSKRADLLGNWFTVGMLDGSAMTLTRKRLVAGCDNPNFQKGRITDPETYLWDLD